jgi:hypothetical protein
LFILVALNKKSKNKKIMSSSSSSSSGSRAAGPSNNGGGNNSNNNNNNNVAKTKCKVVLRPGQRGARIWPKGCKVRNREVDGVKRKVNKQGQLKPTKKKLKTTDIELEVHVRNADYAPSTYVALIWDTGANDSSCDLSDVRKLGLLTKNGNAKKKYQTSPISVSTADTSATPTPATRFHNVRLYLRESGHVSVGHMDVYASASPLLGVSHMRGQRKHLSVKFK